MANWYVSSAAWAAVAAWAASSAYTVGQIVRQAATPSTNSERCFRCTTAGTSGTTEPAWVLTKNGTTTDGGVTWTECTGQEAYQSPGAWAPFARVTAYTSSFGAAGDTLYVGSAHNEIAPGNTSITLNPPSSLAAPAAVYCVDETVSGHIPPTGSDLKTTAACTTQAGSSGQLSIAIGSATGLLSEIFGITFACANGATTTNNISVNNAKLNACVLKYLSTNTGGLILGSQNAAGKVILENTQVQFSSVNHAITAFCPVDWRKTASAVLGTVPTSLFNAAVTTPLIAIEAVDLSAMGAGKSIVNTAQASPGRFFLKNCLLGSGALIVSATPAGPGYPEVDLLCCDSGAIYLRNERYRAQGTLTTDIGVVRTGGAADAGVPISHKIATTANVTWPQPFEGFPIAIYNGVTGANVTVTVEGIVNGSALPNNDEFWISASYLGSASNPLASTTSGSKANNLAIGVTLTASAQAWDSAAPARANSTAYALGQVVKSAANAGRVFFCTTAGTSASSEPGGFASAADGGSVTDGTAVFRAGVRFKQSVVLSAPQPQHAGVITVTPKAAKPSTTYYVDPLITLS